MSGTVRVRVTVNDERRETEVEPRLLLVHYLRDVLGLTGTHVGCDTSNCGACTVHLDGEAVKSCTILAVQADGAEVTTIEGMASPDGTLHPLQEAFWNAHALQCGYCTPGMIMSAADLLQRNPNPSEEEIRHGLEGNLCRCTGYHNIVRAVQDAAKGQTIGATDASAAKARPGIVAVYTGEDMDAGGPMPTAWAPPGVTVNTPEHYPLAKVTVNHVGDAVAAVVGIDRYAVVDAAEDVLVDYEPLPVVMDLEEALKDEVVIHESLGTNKSHEWSLGGGDVEAGLREADVVIERRIVNHRISGAAIEPRAVLAEYRAGNLTIWSSTQVPHFLRNIVAALLGISADRVRAIAPEVGGGFGSKLQIYGEEVFCAWAARKLDRPIKWVATRSDDMATMHHGRDQIAYVRMGAKRDGTITAFHTKIIADLGAYHMLLTPSIPSFGGFVMSGVYTFPAVQTDVIGVLTNKFPTDAIRGAGRPEATHQIELMMDQMAQELGMDPLELRRKNFIPPHNEPHETAIGVMYDSGNHDGTLDKLLEHVDVAGFRAEQEKLRSEGVYRGVGFCTYTEVCGVAPTRVFGPGGFGVQGGGWESGMVRVNTNGSVTVYTGTSPHGQGHETGFAQIVGDRLGVDPQQVEV